MKKVTDSQNAPAAKKQAYSPSYDDTVKTFKQFMVFGMIGATGMAVGIGVVNLVMFQYKNFVLANIIAFFIAATWNFVLNRRFTFKIPQNTPFLPQWAMFLGSCVLGTICNWSISFSLYYTVSLFKEHYNFALIIGVAVGCVANFACAKYFVFKRK